MIETAIDAGIPAGYVTAYEAYGLDRFLRAALQHRGVGYVLAVAASTASPSRQTCMSGSTPPPPSYPPTPGAATSAVRVERTPLLRVDPDRHQRAQPRLPQPADPPCQRRRAGLLYDSSTS